MLTKLTTFLAFVLTFAVTRLGEAYFQFKPTRDLPFWLGALVDFGIWMVVFSCFLLGLTKLAARQKARR